MSRIGQKPITIPSGVTVTVNPGNFVTVKGPKGELSQQLAHQLKLNIEENQLSIERPNNLREVRSQHGLARTLVDNMVIGVTKGHAKVLEIHGVGYRVTPAGKGLNLSLGFSHPVNVPEVSGIQFELSTDEKTRIQKIKVSGVDKQLVGQVAADIRRIRRPDPYKGKGIRYEGEVVKLRPGKRASAKK